MPLNDYGRATLKSTDLTRFIKSLRKHFERLGHLGIKYVAGSEYGSHFQRPHYHIIFYNLPLDDLVVVGKNKIGDIYYESKLISKYWIFGMHKIGLVTFESAGYVARYTLKKSSLLDYKNLGIEPEKLRMSKGVGKNYFDENYHVIFKKGYVVLPTKKGNRKFALPSYFYRLLSKKTSDYKLLDSAVRRKRKYAERSDFYLDKKSPLTRVERLASQQARDHDLKRILQHKK